MTKLIPIPIPDIGDFDSVEVIEVMVKVGDLIKKEDSLITVESDKASMDIPSPFEGVVKEIKIKVGDQVKKLIQIAMEANLYGIICSPIEIKMIKKIAPKLKCFTPGIRMMNTKDDQKRTMSANEAIKEGSDCLIIGRPITKGNPKENIKNILSSID